MEKQKVTPLRVWSFVLILVSMCLVGCYQDFTLSPFFRPSIRSGSMYFTAPDQVAQFLKDTYGYSSVDVVAVIYNKISSSYTIDPAARFFHPLTQLTSDGSGVNNAQVNPDVFYFGDFKMSWNCTVFDTAFDSFVYLANRNNQASRPTNRSISFVNPGPGGAAVTGAQNFPPAAQSFASQEILINDISLYNNTTSLLTQVRTQIYFHGWKLTGR